MKKTLLVLVALLISVTGCNLNTINETKTNQQKTDAMTEAEARLIAEKTCIKGGEALGAGIYNEITKTWWFDANLNATQPGCNPACVVNEETKTAEINWRCTGLKQPEELGEKTGGNNTNKEIELLFASKYPDQAQNVKVTINKETAEHARGEVAFAPDEPGGIWLAVKTNGVWRIVHDGNGSIPCSLKTDFGFPAEMLADCAG